MKRIWVLWMVAVAWAQPPGMPGPPPGMSGMPGMPGMQERKLVKQYDRDGDGRLNAEERSAAREAISSQPNMRRFGPPGRSDETPPQPGVQLKQADVKRYGNEPLYDAAVLRTIFFEFESKDWEKELAAFHNSDVEVPARVTVDGKTYENVGVRFRGMTSFMMAGEGRKRPLNVSFDFADKKQKLLGYRTLNLLNASMDPTFLRSVLYLQAARDYMPASKANYVRVVINGENWGVYPNVQQFNTDFVKEWFGTTEGARWKVPGSPMGRGGLRYLGDDPASYKQIYSIRSKDRAEDWAALIRLCKVLSETPFDRLEAEAEKVLDVEGALRFLALEKTLINSDGYWVRASDYNLYLDTKGRFHLIPHDTNETFSPAEGGPGMGGPPPGMRFAPPGMNGPPPAGEFPPPMQGAPRGGMRGMRGPGMGGARDAKLDLFAGSDDPNKTLLNRLLAVPKLRERYLTLCREIAAKWLDWEKLEPLVRQYQALIGDDVRRDTRKLFSTEAFTKAVTEEIESQGFGPFGGKTMSLKQFAMDRKAYVLQYRDAGVKQAAREQQPLQ